MPRDREFLTRREVLQSTGAVTLADWGDWWPWDDDEDSSSDGSTEPTISSIPIRTEAPADGDIPAGEVAIYQRETAPGQLSVFVKPKGKDERTMQALVDTTGNGPATLERDAVDLQGGDLSGVGTATADAVTTNERCITKTNEPPGVCQGRRTEYK